MRHTLLVVTACALALAAEAAAQSAALTESEALRQLSPDSPRVLALRAEIELARADVADARRFPNPRLTTSREAVAGVVEHFALVAQPLPVTGRRRLETRVAETMLRAAELRVSNLERLARAELRLAFADLVDWQTREQELAQAVDRLNGLLDVVQRRERAGDAAGFERLRLAREVADLEATLADASATRREAQGALAAFFSPSPDPSTLRAAIPAHGAAAVPALDELLALAERSRGDLRALELDEEAARLARRAAERRALPEPELTAGVKTSNAGTGDRGSVFSVSASLALFDRAAPERARAVARERQARAHADTLRARIRADVSALRGTVVVRRAALEDYQRSAVRPSAELLRIARVRYEAGESDLLELLDAYRAAAAARTRASELRTRLAEAEIRLELASGWEVVR